MLCVYTRDTGWAVVNIMKYPATSYKAEHCEQHVDSNEKYIASRLDTGRWCVCVCRCIFYSIQGRYDTLLLKREYEDT